MAAVLILEQGSNYRSATPNRSPSCATSSSLPQPEPIEPDGQPMSGLPLVRVPRLKIENVSDDDLVHALSPIDPGRRRMRRRCDWLAKRCAGRRWPIAFRRPTPISA